MNYKLEMGGMVGFGARGASESRWKNLFRSSSNIAAYPFVAS
jgi:hypothetical protein